MSVRFTPLDIGLHLFNVFFSQPCIVIVILYCFLRFHFSLVHLTTLSFLLLHTFPFFPVEFESLLVGFIITLIIIICLVLFLNVIV